MQRPDLVENYRHDGYVVAESLLEPELVQSLSDTTARLSAAAQGLAASDDVYEMVPKGATNEMVLERIKSPHKVDPVYDQIIHHPAIVEILKTLLGPNVRLQNSKLNLKSSGGASVEWHQDWAFYPHTNDNVLAVGVMIDAMTAENGPLMMVPGTHTGPVFDHHSSAGFFVGAVANDIAAECQEKAVALTAPAGSVSFHHARILHGSEPNRSGDPRRLLLFEAMAADAWPIAGSAAPFKDWDEMNSRMICGVQPVEARVAPVPVRMPQPTPPVATSIFALQHQGENRLLSDKVLETEG